MKKMKIAAIDFGTSKIVTIIGRGSSADKIRLLGSGTVPYDGFQDGDWNTPGQMIQRVRDSISAAELESGEKITEIYVGVPGEYIHVRSAVGMVEIEDGMIHEEDIEAVQDDAADKLNIAEMPGMVLHRSISWYSVDNGPHVMSVSGHANRLEAQTTFILADEQFVSDVTEILGVLGITVLGFLSTTFGEARYMTSVEDRDRSAVLIDCGYLNTEISVMHGEALVYHAMLPMGGGHITADLATELRIPMRSAEQIKRKYSFVNGENASIEFETYDGYGQKVIPDIAVITRSIEGSMKELSGMIQMTISNDINELMKNRSGIVLTGGGIAMMPGARQYLEEALGKTVSARVPVGGKLDNEIFDSIRGLLDLTIDSIDDRSNDDGGIFKKMTGSFRKK